MKDSDLDFSSPRSVEKQVNGECRIMIQLILTEEQQHILDPSAEPVLDRSGRLLVFVAFEVSEAEVAEAQRMAAKYDDLTGTDHGLSDEDLARIAQSSRNLPADAPTLREVIDRLKTQETAVAK